jgi:hypothetical protein
LGAAIATWNIIIGKATAEKLSATMWDSNKALPAALLAQSRGAAVGLGLVVMGTVLQMIGTWMAP